MRNFDAVNLDIKNIHNTNSNTLATMVSFNICVDETGNQSENILTEIRRVVRDSLELHPTNANLIRDSLAISLALSGVMGDKYRYLWVDKIGLHFFINIATRWEGGSMEKHVLICAIRRKVGDTLKEISMDTILGKLRGSEDMYILELPKTLQIDLKDAFDRK